MNRTALWLLVSSLLAVSAGVAWIYLPAGVIVLGLLLGVAGVSSLDAKGSP